MSYTVLKRLKCERLLKRQAKFDLVIAFDEEFETYYNHRDTERWLTFVDFCSIYKFDMDRSRMRTASYREVVNKANEWIAALAQNRREKLHPNDPKWSVVGCETLYAKVAMRISEGGEITSKKVVETSKWPLIDELYVNHYGDGNFASQNFDMIFAGKFIVLLLRVWLKREPDVIGPEVIGFRDYWPKMVPQEEWTEKGKRPVKDNFSDVDCAVGLEKMEQITSRINLDILNGAFKGRRILGVLTVPFCFNGEVTQGCEVDLDDLSSVSSGHIVNLVRVFHIDSADSGPSTAVLDQPRDYLLGFADFIPKCITGGGFIAHPKFETQSALIEKVSQWLAAQPELRFLNCNSVDVKLKSMTSIDTGEMTFTRNTGDFIRILRVCYLKPADMDREAEEIQEEIDCRPIDPPPAPMYLQCRPLVSGSNSTRELRKQMEMFLDKERWNPETGVRDRWRFLQAESVGIFTSNTRVQKSKNSLGDLANKSFHAISMSSSAMNRTVLNAIHIYYDIGFFGQQARDEHAQHREMKLAAEREASLQVAIPRKRCHIL